MDYNEKFKNLPETTQRFLIELVDEHGVNPLGERLIRNSRIHKITYGPDSMVWQVGREFTVPVDSGRNEEPVKCEITDIYFDWVTSMEMKRPIHVVLAERLDGIGGKYVLRYLAHDNFDVLCKPPVKS